MPKVLLADDNVTIHKVVELVLPDEYELRSAMNGVEALSLIRAYRPDIVLADTEMPAMDGYQLCEEIKRNPETASIPVLLMSGAFEPLDEELARRSGADGHLIKPFEASELRSKIDGLLSVLSVPQAELVEEEVEALLAEDDLALIDEDLLFEGEEALRAEDIALEEMPAEEIIAEEITEEEEFVTPQAPKERGTAPSDRPRVVSLPEEFDAGMLADILKEAVNARVAEVFRTVDFKELLLEAGIKETLEGVLWEVVPDLTEKLVKEALTDTLASLRKQLENVIWETVPDMAESIIRKEIENIRSESR